MDKNYFIENYRNAFGNYELPIAIWYSEEPAVPTEKTTGCFIKYLKPAREGQIVSLSLETITCMGGKTYTGLSAPFPQIPKFVSEKELYKRTPELVSDFINDLNMPSKIGQFINFASIERIDNFENIEGLIFFATPDVLTGLVSWAMFDTNQVDAVSVPFGSGCSSTVSQVVVENKNNGNRVFIGFFDPSVRPQVEPNILSFAIPMSRFKKMYYTFNESCLSGSRAWSKVKERIEVNGI
ncbi:MAG TPA: DUF169 domain-containing protein [Bacteroidales bacterium]